MIAILDQLIGALRHHERRPADQYRLVRFDFRSIAQADHWLRTREDEYGRYVWRTARDSDASRRAVIYQWITLRRRHHVAWLERGGSER